MYEDDMRKKIACNEETHGAHEGDECDEYLDCEGNKHGQETHGDTEDVKIR